MTTQADLATAIDCMLEGTYATGFCTGTWGQATAPENGELEDMSSGRIMSDADQAEFTCAEGALIYGAIVLRGYDRAYTGYLLELLENAYISKYDRAMYDDNDSPSNSGILPKDYDTRHDVIARAKDLL